jgi:hypothetical protein
MKGPVFRRIVILCVSPKKLLSHIEAQVRQCSLIFVIQAHSRAEERDKIGFSVAIDIRDIIVVSLPQGSLQFYIALSGMEIADHKNSREKQKELH